MDDVRAVLHEPYIAVARFWAEFDVTPSDEQRREKMHWGNRALAALDGHLSERGISSPTATRSPTSRCTPTRTLPVKAASTSPAYPASSLAGASGGAATAHRDHGLTNPRRPRGQRGSPRKSPPGAVVRGSARAPGRAEGQSPRLRMRLLGIGTGDSFCAAMAAKSFGSTLAISASSSSRSLDDSVRGPAAGVAQQHDSRRRSRGVSRTMWLCASSATSPITSSRRTGTRLSAARAWRPDRPSR